MSRHPEVKFTLGRMACWVENCPEKFATLKILNVHMKKIHGLECK